MTDPGQLHVAGVAPGDVLAGKYRVERILGAGGMGVVVAAHHIQLDTKVAIKFLLPQAVSNAEAVARFAREARAAVKITTEHVARVIDVGTLETGAPYMVMEYLEGGDLGAWLQQRGPLPIEQAAEFVLQACVAVAEAHGLGIVHRDLKPANLFCIRRPDGQLSIKVLDFGISKLTDTGRGSQPPGMSVTKTNTVMGSPLYMSPEQMQSSKGVDTQSDIWALGIILYELLAGRVPFQGDAPTEVAIKVAMEAPPPLRSFRPDVPPGLDAIILRCLQKDRRMRFRNVAELAVALAEFAPRRARAYVERITGTIHASGLSASALDLPPSAQVPGTAISPGTIAPVGQTAPGIPGLAPRKTGVLVVLGLAGVLFFAGAAAFLVRSGSPRRATNGPSASGSSVALASSPPPPSESVAPTVLPLPLPSPADTVNVPVIDAGAPSRPAVAPAVPLVSPPGPAAAPAPQASAAPAPQASAAAPKNTGPANAGLSPGCDPPYTLDDQGRKHFKPDCFPKK